MSINLQREVNNRVYSFCTSYVGSAPYTIKMVMAEESPETQTIALHEIGERVYFDIDTNLKSGIGSYFIYANGVEVERGVVKIYDENENLDVEYNG